MADKSSPSWMKDPANAYRAVGFVFMVAAVGFIFSGNTGIWVSFFAIGIVFFSLGFTQKQKSEPDAETPPEDRPEA